MTRNERVIYGMEPLAKAEPRVLTIGNFDGVHLGHQAIVRAARSVADRAGADVAAMTFEPPPDLALRPDDEPQRILPADEKARLLLAQGADRVIFIKPDEELLAMSPMEFVDRIIIRHFMAGHVVEGEDFNFGVGRSGNIHTLAAAGKARNFSVHVVRPVRVQLEEGPVRVSSTLIRMLVAAGRVADAGSCLGRSFTLFGTVIAGAGRGRLLRFPTANINPNGQILPRHGVYAGYAIIDGHRHASAVSIGNKPTFGPSSETAVEAFLIDAGGDYYGKEMAIQFIARLRDQARFDDEQTLAAQIVEDVERVRKICR